MGREVLAAWRTVAPALLEGEVERHRSSVQRIEQLLAELGETVEAFSPPMEHDAFTGICKSKSARRVTI
jgi:hypothetical protein